ncbi:MAG TPA: decarboxylating 6-phosphogluconate dehydrogenase [Candidatus Acidoferrales bacterium]|nr:decarboxylating 6-phosphogluconate dehydrogenase [Candidatus Acidoferrales bacterium]
MQVGFVGLGRMGSAMVARLLRAGHSVVVYDLQPERARALARKGARASTTLGGVLEQLKPPRIVWLMVPAAGAVGALLRGLESYLHASDIVIDGGNSDPRDSVARARVLRQEGIHFLDVGTSGGIWGEKQGFCLMVGGERDVFRRVEPLFKALAPKDGYAHVGPSGAGHFVKMIHNGIEYGLLEAYGEGFELLAESDYKLDLHQLARLWNRGSVIRSWLLELTESALTKDPRLRGIRGYVDDSGYGRGTMREAFTRGVPAPALAMALFARFRSRQKDPFSAKLIAALRHEFGGHEVKKK